jgi:glucokinase
MNTILREALSKTKPDFTRELESLKEMDDTLKNLRNQRGLDTADLQAKIGQLKAQLSSNKVNAVNKVIAAEENLKNLKADVRLATLHGKQADSYRKAAFTVAGAGTGLGAVATLLNALRGKP